ncbi:Rhodanese-like/PpiC domain-containing protein 12 [Hibiscus syriacus]|uniref:Peptidyl-prolyl cis-trans isomerase n=1 Tax=Hibiscus syriacus TaxID=106335 RepID=A0A6A3B475_HIBSY|nr:Rhodanese-like/PpiC domain-containing protein 12 [Hibiscus syriacus]
MNILCLENGGDLADLAVDYSICPSKEKGGMLGWVRKGQMVPEFEEAAFSAPLNKVVKCKTNFGWHLLQVLSEREESLLKDILPEELHGKLQDPSFIEEAQLIHVREPEEVSSIFARIPVLLLRQLGSWGPEITSKFDPMKDTYVLCHHGRHRCRLSNGYRLRGFIMNHSFSFLQPSCIYKPMFCQLCSYAVLCCAVIYDISFNALHCPLHQTQLSTNQATSVVKEMIVIPRALGLENEVCRGCLNIHCQMGFRKVFNVSGGIHEYAIKVDPSVPTY